MSKYNNHKTVVDGLTFDSKKEANRYTELKLLEKSGEISNLQLQPKFVLQEKFKDGKRVISAITYIADFMYEEGNNTVVEDVKGVETAVFKLKEKMFRCRYPQYVFRKT